MILLKKAMDYNQYLVEHQMAATMLIYRYSEADIVSPGKDVTVLSPERRRLTLNDARYQLYNDAGVYANGVTLDDLKSTLATLRASDHDQGLSANVQESSTIISLIRDLAKMGLTVMGSRYVCDRVWDVDDDRRLVAALLHPQLIDDQPHSEAHEASTLAYDWENTVRRDRQPNGVNKVDEVRFTIQDQAGKPLLRLVPRERLGTVLYALRCGASPQQIREWLLWPRLEQLSLDYAQLSLLTCWQSESRKIVTLKDLLTLDDLTISDQGSGDACWYQFTAQSEKSRFGGAIPFTEAGEALSKIFHGHQYASDRAFSDGLAQLAQHVNLQIQRRQRRLFDIADIDRFKEAEGEIVDMSATGRDGHEGLPETVYEIIDLGSGRTLRYDLSINDLVMALLAFAR
ncbi:hypothetical protein IV54_GL001217 [Levilactobacillus paucivorans]|uniref:Uncharacterized protein n=2 Tax=Levilactobacillus paucivorans TaxID=616990 RepID=A0A0R2LEP9_9LACO|nr:hypothetical protein IV54_GL001217 [Levilactobacillus paucivorans]